MDIKSKGQFTDYSLSNNENPNDTITSRFLRSRESEKRRIKIFNSNNEQTLNTITFSSAIINGSQNLSTAR